VSKNREVRGIFQPKRQQVTGKTKLHNEEFNSFYYSLNIMYQITWCYILKYGNIGFHRQENVKSYISRVAKLIHTREVGWSGCKICLMSCSNVWHGFIYVWLRTIDKIL